MAAGRFQQRLSCCGIPLRGRSEARVEVGLSLGYQAEFQRTAHTGHDMRSEAREIACGLGAGMRTAADHAQRSLRRARMNTALRRVAMPAEGARAGGA